ncbi:N/A [soil metagenome]
MDIGTALDGSRAALQMALLLAGFPLAAALIVGLLVGALQAMTQLHEPTVALVPRLLGVALVVLLLLPWLMDRWVGYAAEVLGSIPEML